MKGGLFPHWVVDMDSVVVNHPTHSAKSAKWIGHPATRLLSGVKVECIESDLPGV